MTLEQFLLLPHRFRWGGLTGDDCVCFCASWIAETTGTDPTGDVRGTYRDAEGASRLLADAGGMVPMFDRTLLPLGFVRTDAPADGDVGVIVAPSGLDGFAKEIGAIRFGPLWATLAPAGVVRKQAEFIAAWRLPV